MSSSLATYLGIVRARWRWLMWGVLLALAATTVALLAEPPQYRTTASVFVRTPGDVTTVLDGGDSYAQGRARTYAALVDNTSLSATVIADLGLDLEPEDLARRIHGTSRPGTVVIDITVSAPDPQQAQQVATVLLAEYAATVRDLESVPASLVPRAELVVIDPPGKPVRVMAWGAPVGAVLAGAVLAGLVLGVLGAVLRSVLGAEPHRPEEPESVTAAPSTGPGPETGDRA
ncbi:YveK family protein [Mycolicibacterium confluentis]|uniref:Cell shape-determining protein n=1 Tax=Mycolicibacterium confluentis TaxID=28047 RepID=A0A7I7XZQ2_9MYCO|nr:hypothetical protein [Mycolicibacterium confluentis]MCV7319840.1 cell shape-determining protein [Mycolicibacterium confluentis]BBZ34870.1 hypothetical protein MCNF_34750 [Mycolicibacterium confluentis]